MKSKKILSVRDQMKLMYVANGAAWLVAGIFGIFDNIPCIIIHILGLCISIGLMVYVAKSEKEVEDELAIKNILGAKALTLTRMHIAYCVIAVALMFVTKIPFEFELDWRKLIVPMFFVIIGIEYIMTGVTFQRLEDD